MSANNALRVVLVSDTHGLLRPEARAFAAGCDYIVHGGDIGSAAILEQLSAMAPLSPRRFKLPISVGEIRVDGTQVEARTLELTG